MRNPRAGIDTMKSRSRIKIFLYLHFDGQTGVYILQGCGAGAGAVGAEIIFGPGAGIENKF